MKKQKTNIIIGILIISVLLISLFGGIYYFNKKSEVGGLLSYKAYDSNGNPVNTGLTQSILNGVPNIAYIDLTVTLTNTGSQPLSCTLSSISPSQFNSAIEKSTKSLLVGSKVAWTSGLISLSSLENISGTTTFSATAKCTYASGSQTISLPDKTGTIVLDIKPDTTGTGSFEISLNQGGSPTEYCGDKTCQSSETSVSCPNDCAIATNVKFRTSDLTYVSGTAIAYNSGTCGGTLIAYGKTSGACTTLYCDTATPILLVPSSSGTTKLFTDNADLCVCDPSTSSSHTYPKRYTTADSDASKVDTSSTSIDSAKEVGC